MARKLKSLAQEFLDSVYVSGYVPGGNPKASHGRKRATNTCSDKPRKATRTADVGDMQDIATSGKVGHIALRFDLSNLTVTLYKGKSESKIECYFSKVMLALVTVAYANSLYLLICT
jgi:hypothetical protein